MSNNEQRKLLAEMIVSIQKLQTTQCILRVDLNFSDEETAVFNHAVELLELKSKSLFDNITLED